MVVAKVDPGNSKEILVPPEAQLFESENNEPIEPPPGESSSKKPCCEISARQRRRIKIVVPLMILVLLIAIGLVLVFEITCKDTLKVTKTINVIYHSLQWIQGCNYLVIIFVLGAVIGVSIPSNSIIDKSPLALTCTAMILILFIISVFPAAHFLSESAKIDTGKGLLNYNKLAKAHPYFHKREFVWLVRIQKKLGCCGLEDYEQYNKSDDKTFNDGDWIHTGDFLNNDTDVPDSCCKKVTPGCGKNAFSNTDIIHKKGCRVLVDEKLKECESVVWLMAFLPLIIGTPACALAYMYTRHAQGLQPCGACCSNSILIKDPEQLSEPRKSRISRSKVFKKSRDGLVADVAPSMGVVYRVVEHVPPPKRLSAQGKKT